MALKRLTYLLLILLFAHCDKSYPENAIQLKQLGIWVDETEVTASEYEEFRFFYDMKTASDSLGGFVFNAETSEWEEKYNVNHRLPDGEMRTDSLSPAVHVSWNDACAYCNAKNGRLPTVEEWESFASGEFLAGNIWEGYFPFKDEGMDGFKHSVAEVKSFKPNRQGLYDVYGNVWEWTNTSDSSGSYFIKGGSFLTDYTNGGFLPNYRKSLQNTTLRNDLGFRCVYEID